MSRRFQLLALVASPAVLAAATLALAACGGGSGAGPSSVPTAARHADAGADAHAEGRARGGAPAGHGVRSHAAAALRAQGESAQRQRRAAADSRLSARWSSTSTTSARRRASLRAPGSASRARRAIEQAVACDYLAVGRSARDRALRTHLVLQRQALYRRRGRGRLQQQPGQPVPGQHAWRRGVRGLRRRRDSALDQPRAAGHALRQVPDRGRQQLRVRSA